MSTVLDKLPANALSLLAEIRKLAQRGSIPAVSNGSGAIGMTLLDALGVDYTTARKPDYHGIIVTARRSSRGSAQNRVNLFAMVPDWSISACKSAAEVVDRFGYPGENGMQKLHCTIRARHENSKGLYLELDQNRDLLHEKYKSENQRLNVATWRIESLVQRLAERRPASMWVVANSHFEADVEYFHYRIAIYTGPPKLENFAQLLSEGTITVDHQIDRTTGGAADKGPHFKILPRNISMLFPDPVRFDLLSM